MFAARAGFEPATVRFEVTAALATGESCCFVYPFTHTT
jgi:hypothetical protein